MLHTGTFLEIRMTNTQILMAALAYAQCGSWREVSESFDDLTKEAIRMRVGRVAKTDLTISNAIAEGALLSQRLASERRREAALRPQQLHVRNDLALKRDREIYKARTAQPSPSTIGQYLMGEPLPGRSALDKINTDQRCDSTKTDPRFIRRVFGSDNGRRNVVTLKNIQLSQTV